MTMTSFQEGCSRRKRKAKRRTKPSADDLHMAEIRVSTGSGRLYSNHNLLKKVNVINFKLILPSPMSMPVAAPQGPMRVR
jgi:hypothetical protein